MSIANSAIEGYSKMLSLTIPNSVTYIGINSFKTCNSLETIVFNSITSLTLSNFAFSNYDSLTSIVFKSKPLLLGDNVFYKTSNIKTRTFTIYLQDSSVKSRFAYIGKIIPRYIEGSTNIKQIIVMYTLTRYYLVVATNNSKTVSNLNFEAIKIS